MQRRRRKRFRAETRVRLAVPTRAMDYTHDQMAGGRKFRTLNLMDGYTREALRIEPGTSLPGLRVCGSWSRCGSDAEDRRRSR